MAPFSILPPAVPPTGTEPPVDLLLQALSSVLPTGFLDLLLDRIEDSR